MSKAASIGEVPKSEVCSDPKVIKDLLDDFFRELNRESLSWAVTSGWELLPDYARHDLDVLVVPNDKGRVIELAMLSAKKNGWKVYAQSPAFGGGINIFLTKYIETLQERAYFEIDICWALTFHGVERGSVEAVVQNAIVEPNGIRHVSVGVRGAGIVLKELLANGTIKGELRHQYVLNALANDLEVFRRTLEPVCGFSLANKIVKCVQDGKITDLDEYTLVIRRKMKLKLLLHPLGFMRWVGCCAFKCFHPVKRMFVAFVGPDGCGKTTIADAIEEKFFKHPFFVIRRTHFVFGPLPYLYTLKGFFYRLIKRRNLPPKKTVKAGTVNAGMADPLSVPMALLYTVYYGIDQFLGWLMYLRWTPSFPSLVIADRYYYDFFTMRGYMRCPVWIKRLFARIIPQPDLIFFLDRPAEEIHCQKPELTIDEIRRQQKVIRQLLCKDRRGRCIDASKGVDDTVRRVAIEVERWIAGE